jgi:hypothetical protein
MTASTATRPPPVPELKPMVIPGRSVGEQGAVTAFFWAGLVRVSLLHHVTWSINSIPARLARLTTTDRARHRDAPNEELTP